MTQDLTAAAEPQETHDRNRPSKHRELNHTIFNLATCVFCASDMLERIPMLVEIAEGLSLCSKRRLETAHLPDCADR